MGYRDCADLRSFAAANGLDGKSDDEVGEARSNKFPMHICRAFVYIGALIAHQDGEHWIADAPGAPHVGERPEKKLIASFFERFLVIPVGALNRRDGPAPVPSISTFHWATP